MVYEEKILGVFIQGVSGSLYKRDEWKNQETPNGIAVFDDNCKFVMALNDTYSDTLVWGGNGILISGITTTTNLSEALIDYDGETQTDVIISRLSSGSYAANYCKSLFPNGQTGYLGAVGEWSAAFNNKSEIALAIGSCGGSQLSTHYWTSTQYNSSKSWMAAWNEESFSDVSKRNETAIRMFCSIE